MNIIYRWSVSNIVFIVLRNEHLWFSRARRQLFKIDEKFMLGGIDMHDSTTTRIAFPLVLFSNMIVAYICSQIPLNKTHRFQSRARRNSFFDKNA